MIKTRYAERNIKMFL